MYDSGPDTAGLTGKTIPLIIGTGSKYLWRVKHISTGSNESDWSEPASLKIVSAATKGHPSLHHAFFADSAENHPVRQIIKERWYDLVLKLSDPAGYDNLSYAIFWSNSAAHTTGTPANRGGRFFPASSYIYNFSIPQKAMYEKYRAGSFVTRNVFGEMGLYIDGTSWRTAAADSTIRCRVKFLKEAKAGPWTLRGFVRNIREKGSPLFYSRFELSESDGRRTPETQKKSDVRYYRIAVTVLAVLLLVLLAVIRKRRVRGVTVVSSRKQDEFKKLEAYILNNISEDLSMQQLETYMNTSYDVIYKMVRAITGKSIKTYVTDLRMEKAKTLLQTSDKTIQQIMEAVGYSNSSHFSGKFRKYTGKTPREFRG
jgi:AraC-like DNA-binding protein